MKDNHIEDFVKTLNRYIEVSHIYFGQLKEAKIKCSNEDLTPDNKYDKLFKFVGDLTNNLVASGKNLGISIIKDEDSKGRNISGTEENIKQTEIYQEMIKKVFNDNIFRQNEVPNKQKIIKLLENKPEDFLGLFPSVSSAWDALTRIASLSFIPSPQRLLARDLIYMHSTELIQHLARLYVLVVKEKGNKKINLFGKYTINELQQFQTDGGLYEKILESSSQKFVTELIDELSLCFCKEGKLKNLLASLTEEVLDHLVQVENGFPDMLEDDNLTISQAEQVCSKLVFFGIAIGYTTWLSFAKESNDPNSIGILQKHCLFSTRYLLDAEKWEICKNVSNVAKEIFYSINEHRGLEKHTKVYMCEANNFFARKKLREKNLECEIQKWKIGEAHDRYKFLSLILLDRFDDPDICCLAKKLLQRNDKGQSDMSIQEFEEWPILKSLTEDDKNSQLWEKIKSYAEE